MKTRTLAARWILPITTPPIRGGWLRLDGESVVECGSGPGPEGTRDLGDVALLPGLVNAHTHLEFSDLRQPIGTPAMPGSPATPLHRWIGEVIAARGRTDAASRRAAVTQGWEESRAAGVRLIGEITTPPCDYAPHCDYATPETSLAEEPSLPPLVRFAEVIGLRADRWQERIAAAVHFQTDAQLELKSAFQPDVPSIGWSPHAPYSTHRDAIAQCVQRAAGARQPLAMHVAESPAERELLESGSGPFADALKELGVWRTGLFPWPKDPIASLIRQLAEAPRALLVHGNDLREDEMETLAQHPNLTVVYCPRTHAHFGYPPHPVATLLAAGVRVALGTDSRASNPDLNLWGEVQWLLRHRQDLDPMRVLAMATVDGAEALGHFELGRFKLGRHPGINIVETTAERQTELWEDFSRNPIRPL